MKRLVMWLSILAVVALVVLNLTHQPGPEPDMVFPMANRNITLEYAGK